MILNEGWLQISFIELVVYLYNDEKLLGDIFSFKEFS